MKVKRSSLDRLEFTLIGLFKIVLMAALCVALVAASLLAARGVLSLQTSPSPETPQGKPPIEAFDQRALLEVLSPSITSPTGTDSANRPVNRQPIADSNSLIYDKQVDDLWQVVQPYQVACGAASPLTREQFAEGLRQSKLEVELRSRGSRYVASQLQFAKQSLSNPSVVQLCKNGKNGIFFGMLEHHLKIWDQHQRDVRKFNDAEREREDRSRHLENLRVTEARAEGYRQLTLAAAAFGVFMSLALVLIFARIEANLRGFKHET